MSGVAVDTRERWTSTDSWLFWSFGLGMLLENYIFSLAPVATGWVKVPKVLDQLMLSWAPIWLIIGIIIFGPIADRFGRKSTFYLTMALYAVGGIILIFAHTYVWILIALALLLLASGGEMNTIMVASHEMMPRLHRSKTMMMELNFINLGAFLLGILAVISSAWNSSETFQKSTVGVALIIVLFVLFLARTRTPESIRWLMRQGRREQAEAEAIRYYGEEQGRIRLEPVQKRIEQPSDSMLKKRVSLGLRFYVTLTTAFAGSAGFGLMTYTLAPNFFPKLTSTIILIAGATGFFSGFFGLFGDRWSRKKLLLTGYLGTFIITVLIYFTLGAWSKSLALFIILLVILNVFVNIGYLTEDALKGEVWPTHRRGTYTAIVRFVSIGLYIPTIYISYAISLKGNMVMNIIIWAIGLTGALLWVARGIETGKGVSIEEASLE
ncbi:Major Facilitator Superfamily protein [Alicyclobacillus tolerans]|uniref:Major Facilitator Superfamily protein n=2 Tax=Alicyclobacillus tolerans TaxID=90970 RepID=A0A1M6N8Q3_9BACL|nr:Major Facilitator Superfamily protein [Alicyclobacillus montanus]